MDLRALRKSKGLTLSELAEKLNVSPSTILRWENGDIANMRRDRIALLAKALEIKPTELLDLPDNNGYYTDPAVNEYAEQLRTNPNMRLLFDATKDMSKEDIDYVVDLVNRLKGKE